MPRRHQWPLVLLIGALIVIALPASAGAEPAKKPSVAPSVHDFTFENSLTLDGDGDFVEIFDDPSLRLDDVDGLTIEAWVRRTSGDRCETIIGKNFAYSYWLGFCNQEIRFYSGGLGTEQDGITAIPAELWTHIAVVWELGGQRRYYINGDLDYTGSAGTAPGSNDDELYIGADTILFPFPGIDYFFAGNIAEVRIWNVARSQNDIRRTMHLALEEPLPGLVANWHLTNDAYDNIGSHNGLPLGDATFTSEASPPIRRSTIPLDTGFDDLPFSLSQAATAYIPDLDRILLIGGASGDFGASTISSEILAVDATTGAVTIGLPSMPEAFYAATATYASVNDTVYVFGGNTSISSPRSLDHIYAIDPVSGAVRLVSETLPAPVSNAVAVYHPGLEKIYILGGNNRSSRLDSINLFDPNTETITTTNMSLHVPLYALAATYSNMSEKIYYFGGWELPSKHDSIYEITINSDGINGTVTEVTSAKLPYRSAFHAAVEDPESGLIYLIGLETPHSVQIPQRVTIFDPVTAQLWETTIKLEDKRLAAGVVYNHRSRHALVIGGSGVDDRADTIWRIPLGDGPAVPLGRWDFPTPVDSEVTVIDGDETRVWVGTTGDGLYRYDEDHLSRFHYTPIMLDSPSGRINDVRYSAANDDAWVATEDAGGKIIDDDFILTYDSSALGTNRILTADFRPRYTEWLEAPFFGTSGHGLKWKKWYPIPPPGGYIWATNFTSQDISAIAHLGDADVWVIADEQLQQLDYMNPLSPTETPYGKPCNLSYSEDMVFDNNHHWWIVSASTGELDVRGICHIPADTVPSPSLSTITPIIGDLTNAVDVDAEGRVWISVRSPPDIGLSGGLAAYEAGTSSGVIRTEEFNWLNAPVGTKDLNNYVGYSAWANSNITTVGAADERVWAGKEDGQLVTLAQRWEQLDESNELDQKIINGVWMARGHAFFGTSNSLHVLLPDGVSWDNRYGDKIWDVMGDSQGRIWVGTNTGIRLYTPSGWDYLMTAPGTRPAYAIYSLAEDQSGRIWIGGLNGLTLYDRERFVATFTPDNSDLPDEKINALLVDHENNLWAGTEAGLALLEASDWTVFTTADGLPSDSIYDLAQLGDGRIAISTSGGLSLYDKGIFTTQTLPIPSSNLPLTVDEQGRLWAGSAVLNGNRWRGYYWTNSGLRSSLISDNAADGADRVWFSHAPDTGVSVRGTYLPPLAHVIPTINGINPDHGSSGIEVTINGEGFGEDPDDLAITIGGAPVEVITAENTEVHVRILDDTVSGDVTVSVGGAPRAFYGNVAGGDPAFCAEPVLNDFSPTGGNDGVYISIRGTNFDRNSQVFLGGLSSRRPHYINPTRLQMIIEPEDGVGLVRVQNRTPGCDVYEDTSSGEFRRIEINLEEIVLNQGIEGTGLVANRFTLIQSYLSHSPQRRHTDRVEFDTVQITFREVGEVPIIKTINICPELTRERSGAPHCFRWIPTSSGSPTDALLSDIVNSFNVTVWANVNGSLFPEDITVEVALKRGPYVVGANTDVWFRSNKQLRVLFVPIMRNDYTATDLNDVYRQVNGELRDLTLRIWPTGIVTYEFGVPFTVDDVLIGSASRIDLGDWAELYDASHNLDRARRWYNQGEREHALIAFGVVDRTVVEGDANGKAFWVDTSRLLNTLLLEDLDTLCDIADAVLTVLTLGLADTGGGCDLEIPLYVGWASSDGGGTATRPRVASTFTHEFGHIMNLVQPYADNGSLTNNLSHSINDELSFGECADWGSGALFNWNLSLYTQPGVWEPVVNPLLSDGPGGPQQLRAWNDGNPGNIFRGKAIMSYACGRVNNNVFFEPVDLIDIFSEMAMHSAGSFVHDLISSPIDRLSNLDEREAVSAVGDDIPAPRPVLGDRLYISGTVNRVTDTGEITVVDTLGEGARLDASYATGYWLVQLDNEEQELARVGIAPTFTTPGSSLEGNDLGFFAASILRHEDIAKLELRKDEVVLDTFKAGSASPDVSISSPVGGAYYDTTIPVTWTATDADGDPLQITILYSVDGGATWTPVKFSEDSDSVEVPVPQVAGSDNNSQIQVIASDGFNNGSATSDAFSVADQPPRAYIAAPKDGSTFLEGQRIQLSGGADDNQDGWVADGFWTSDRDGILGTGSELFVYLSVGTHTLTLEVTNSRGLEDSASVTVTVEGDYDLDGISDAEELAEGLNILTGSDAYSDDDNDGLPLIVERIRGTNPNESDTDGDGRTDAEEIAEGTNPLAVDAPLPPDELRSVPTSLEFEADLSMDIPLPQEQVQVLSRRSVDWQLTADVAWLAASAVEGTTPAGPTILVNAFLLEDGIHNGTLTFTSDDLGDSVDVPVTVTVTNSKSHFEVNGDGWLDIGDVQQVTSRIYSDNTQAGFSYHHDPDRDGDVDEVDAMLMVERWITDRSCCNPDYPASPSILQVNSPSAAAVGQEFAIEIVIDDFTDLGGFEFELSYDPALLKPTEATVDGLLGSTGRTVEVLGWDVDGVAGVISFGGATHGSTLPGPDGGGVIARFTFQALAIGESELDIQNPLLTDVVGDVSVPVDQDGSISILDMYYIYLPLIMNE
ncbi:MAG: hypothetical protein GTO18_12895 [Anaerolineales bacterium]|nr:hypothetical protein [Anaerolineales bacterium]